MSKILEFFKSSHIQIALASGASIIVLAYFSKNVLPQPLSKLTLAIPALVITAYQVVSVRHKGKRISTPWYWCVTILVVTALIIDLSALRKS